YLEAGHEVAVVDNLSTGRRANVAAGAKLHEVDIHSNEFGRILEDFRPEVVNHHAAQASVKVSSTDVVFDLEANGAATARVADLCVAHGVGKMIYSSTGGALYGEPESVPVREDAPIKPLSNY